VTPEPLLVEPHLHEGAEASEVWLQTEQEALEYDLQLIAESEGMTMDEARAAFEHSERLDGLLVELGRGFNDVYAGAFTEHEGGTRSTIRIKGPVPADAARLVEAAGDDFTVVGGSPASRVEMKQIAKIASAHFESVGLHASVIVSVSGDEIRVYLPHLPAMDLEATRAAAVTGISSRISEASDIRIDATGLGAAGVVDPVGDYVSQRIRVSMAPEGEGTSGGGEHAHVEGFPAPDEWGPMVVVDLPTPIGGEASIGSGVLSFDGGCAVIEWETNRSILLFEESTVHWTGEAIHFQHLGFDHVFREGAVVGGAGAMWAPVHEDGTRAKPLTFLRSLPEGCDGHPAIVSYLVPEDDP
jgi:sarcosine oxidase gamma subunit